MKEPVRFAIVGCGRIADLHVPAYLNNPNSKIVAICDIDSKRVKQRALEWNIPPDQAYTDYNKLLQNKNIDAVEILVPHHLHANFTIRATKAGKHVSVQKPMAMNLRECKDMIQAAKKAGVKLRVFENFRFYPPYQKAKQLIDEGVLGRPSFIRIKLGQMSHHGGWEVPADSWMWRLTREYCGGGVLVWDDGYHKFSIANYFLGEVEKVKAWIDFTGLSENYDEPPLGVDAPSIIIWKYKTPRTYGSFEVTYSRENQITSEYYCGDERVEITGDRGYIWINQCTAHTVRNEAPMITHIQGELTEYNDIDTDWKISFTQSVNHFVEAIMNDTEPSLTGKEGMEIQKFAIAALKSAEIGTEILVDSFSE
ncbi:MAG: Gfo/Idh/MocA family oxidoreductase [Candidatus Thorarchaeota archaeon]